MILLTPSPINSMLIIDKKIRLLFRVVEVHRTCEATATPLRKVPT